MVRNYKRLTPEVSRESIERAWKAVMEDGWTQREAAEAFMVPRSTLQRWLKKDLAEFPERAGSGRFQTVFSKEQEEELVDFLIDVSNR